MPHGNQAGGPGSPRWTAVWSLLLGSILFFLTAILSFEASGEFLLRHDGRENPDSASHGDPPRADGAHTTDSPSARDSDGSRGGITTWDRAYGAMLLLNAEPLEGMQEAKGTPQFRWARVVLPFFWDLVFASFLALVVVFRRGIWNALRFAIASPQVVVFGWGPTARTLALAAIARGARVAVVVDHPDEDARSFCDANAIPLVRGGFKRHREGGYNFRLSVALRLAWARHILFVDADDGRNIDQAIAVADLAEHPILIPGARPLLLALRAISGTLLRRRAAWSGLRHAHVGDPLLLRNLESSGLLERHETIPFSGDELRARHAIEIVAPLRGRVVHATGPGTANAACGDDTPTFEPVHLFVFGDGRLARALVVEFLHAGQWSPVHPPRITLVAGNSDSQLRILKGLYPNIDRCSHLDAWPMDVPSLELHERMESMQAAPSSRRVLLVADPDSPNAVATGLWLSRVRSSGGPTILIPCGSDHGAFRILSNLRGELDGAESEIAELEARLSRMGERDGRGEKLLKSRKLEVETLRDAFDFSDRIAVYGDPVSSGMLLFDEGFYDRTAKRFREAAEIFHETYSNSRGGWPSLHPSFRISNRSAFRHARHKLSALCDPSPADLHSALERNVEALSRLEHLRWNAERWLSGWRYGPVKSERDRISPYLVPWEDLDEAIREYDRISVRTVGKVMATLAEGRSSPDG